jgi:cytidyltransferase-like protein
MSATLLHHGHVRLLKRASGLGSVVVLLCSDEEIRMQKGLEPELSFIERSEVMKAIKYVDEVIEAPWILNDSFLDLHEIDLLVHGDDNRNAVDDSRIVIFPRTQGVSSTILRERAFKNLAERAAGVGEWGVSP